MSSDCIVPRRVQPSKVAFLLGSPAVPRSSARSGREASCRHSRFGAQPKTQSLVISMITVAVLAAASPTHVETAASAAQQSRRRRPRARRKRCAQLAHAPTPQTKTASPKGRRNLETQKVKRQLPGAPYPTTPPAMAPIPVLSSFAPAEPLRSSGARPASRSQDPYLDG